MENIIEIKGLAKNYSKFSLGPIDLDIPRGFATALIGANGAGKTTFIDALCGIIKKSGGSVNYFGKTDNVDDDYVRNAIGYCAATSFLPMGWTAKNIAKAMSLGFDNFSAEKFDSLCEEFKIDKRTDKKPKTIIKMSDGNKMRTYLAAVMARNTELLVLDEPASMLDPLMRDLLCEKFRQYLAENEQRSIIFSTHNIADMEFVTDYAVFMANGKIIEQGFVEELKEKYLIVRGDGKDMERVRPYMMTLSGNRTTFEGCSLAENADMLKNFDVVAESPTLQQLSVAILKKAEMEG